MNFNLNNYLNILSLIAMAVVAFYVVRSKVKNENLKDLQNRVTIMEKERDETARIYAIERDEARKQHIENQKAIANLEGQLKTYKEIPLKKIADSLGELSESNHQILSVLKNSATILADDKKEQHVNTQLVEHQIVK